MCKTCNMSEKSMGKKANSQKHKHIMETGQEISTFHKLTSFMLVQEVLWWAGSTRQFAPEANRWWSAYHINSDVLRCCQCGDKIRFGFVFFSQNGMLSPCTFVVCNTWFYGAYSTKTSYSLVTERLRMLLKVRRMTYYRKYSQIKTHYGIVSCHAHK